MVGNDNFTDDELDGDGDRDGERCADDSEQSATAHDSAGVGAYVNLATHHPRVEPVR